jgi:hypothetical protein
MPLGVPAVAGVIDRRILLNYRVDPAAMAAALPDRFEPLTVDGHAVGGICLIRLRNLRPRGLPAALGVGSENAAHRVAVSWEREDGTPEEPTAAGGAREEGVYVPRRDTSSRLFAAGGGRLFSDRHFLAEFDVREGGDRYEVTMASRDGAARVHVAGERADALPADSAFDSLAAASSFFERGSLGVSNAGDREDYYAIELRTDQWSVEPLAVEAASSSYFEDDARFPPDAVELDHALLMGDVDHTWHEKEPLCASG